MLHWIQSENAGLNLVLSEQTHHINRIKDKMFMFQHLGEIFHKIQYAIISFQKHNFHKEFSELSKQYL